VEKPFDAENHNICIYFLKKAYIIPYLKEVVQKNYLEKWVMRVLNFIKKKMISEQMV